MSVYRINREEASNFLKRLPNAPGVYVFRDAEKQVLYVGRATSLRSRVSSYFSGRDSRGERIFRMVALAKTVETIETETVLESVILESNLIKKYLPKYNVDLKDDKSFSYFAVTKEEFPRVIFVRETEIYKTEKKKSGIQKEEKKGQLYSHVYGPYTSRRHMETVLRILRKIFPFHSGAQYSEKGCLYRQIGLCPGPHDGGIDKVAYRKNIRGIEYVLRGQKKQLLATLEKEMRCAASTEDFERAKVLRGQVFALRHIRDIALLTRGNAPSVRRGEPTFPPLQGEKIRIEAFDISNISGQHAVASMVVFENGEPKKSEYRRFKIQSVEGSNDVAMMREVLARRVRHAEWKTPDTIILDGGRGHLAMAVSLWKALDAHIPLVAIAKGPTRKKVELHVDPQFAPDPKLLEDARVLEHLREESHRFAIAHHRKVREKSFLE